MVGDLTIGGRLMKTATRATRASGPSVVVSVHDVAPAHLAEIRSLLSQLDELNVRPRSLLVIPFAQGQDDIRHCPELVDLLHQEIQRGSEVILHGYTHRRVEAWRGSPLTRARAALFARQVAEFASTAWPEQRARLLAGRALLQDIGIEVSGFCPPGWLSTPELPELLRETGFRYLVAMSWVQDLEHGRRIPTPWLGYIGAGRLHEELVRIGAALLSPWRQRSRAISVFLHPQGASQSPACARVLLELARLLRDRRPVTYDELLDWPS